MAMCKDGHTARFSSLDGLREARDEGVGLLKDGGHIGVLFLRRSQPQGSIMEI